MKVKKQWLVPCLEQLICSRSRKEYHRTVCCHPVCLTYMLSTLWEMSGWMSYKLESRQVGETSTISDMWMLPLLIFLHFIFIWGKIALQCCVVSAIQQCKSAVIIHISPRSWASLPSVRRSTPLNHHWVLARLGFLCYTATSHQLSVLDVVVYLCPCCFLHLSCSLNPTRPQVCICSYSFPGNRFINTTFLDSIYMH